LTVRAETWIFAVVTNSRTLFPSPILKETGPVNRKGDVASMATKSAPPLKSARIDLATPGRVTGVPGAATPMAVSRSGVSVTSVPLT
jgi:hypothetical protein